MNDNQKPTYTYTITALPNTQWNLVLNIPLKRDIDAEVEKKLTTMQEYTDAKNLLGKFTLNGKN